MLITAHFFFFLEEKAQALLEHLSSGGFAFATSQPRDHFNRTAYPVMVLENEDISVTKNTNPEMLGNC